MRQNGDSGVPLMVSHSESPASQAMREIAGKAAAKTGVQHFLAQPAPAS